MTITIGASVIPWLLTAFCVCMILRPWHSTGSYDFSFVRRVLWLIPILFVWCVYFAILCFIIRK
jgi:hypothetical protein